MSPRQNRSLSNGDYCVEWARRYLRESKAELIAASRARLWFVASGFALSSMKKSQAAIYCALGDPETIESVVRNHSNSESGDVDPLLRILVRIEALIASRSLELGHASRKSCLTEASRLHKTAERIVDIFLSS